MTVTEETLLKTRRFTVVRLSRPIDGGAIKRTEIVRHPGSVVVLPLLENDQICLIRNVRLTVGAKLIELPAGTLEPGEDPQACAERELIEETGYRPGSMTHLVDFYPAPGLTDERMHLFLASNLTPGPPAREPEEQIENLIVTRQQAFAYLRSGEIVDAKTMIGLMLLAQWELPK